LKGIEKRISSNGNDKPDGGVAGRKALRRPVDERMVIGERIGALGSNWATLRSRPATRRQGKGEPRWEADYDPRNVPIAKWD